MKRYRPPGIFFSHIFFVSKFFRIKTFPRTVATTTCPGRQSSFCARETDTSSFLRLERTTIAQVEESDVEEGWHTHGFLGAGVGE